MDSLTNQDFRLLVVGLGKLGHHHAEAAAQSSLCGEIWGWDISEAARKSFRSIGSKFDSETKSQFIAAEEARLLPPHVNLMIVATTAQSRGSVLAQLMETTRPDCVLLEKPLSSSLNELEILRKVCPVNTYVNFPRRYSAIHVEAIRRAATFPREGMEIVVKLPWATMLSNASHFIDFATELLGENPERVAIVPAGVTVVRSKREGFMDIQGEMFATFPSSAKLTIKATVGSDRLPPAGVTIAIKSGSRLLQIDEHLSTLSDNAGETSQLAGPPLQSKLTGHYLEQLQLGGSLDLPSFTEASPAHELVLRAVEKIEDELNLELPFT